MSNEPKAPKEVLHAPEQAVDSYLASLLSEVDEYIEQDQLNLKTQQETKPRLAEVVEIRKGVQTEIPVQAPETVEIAQTADKPVEASQDEVVTPAEIVPEWGEQPFQSLPFKVRGMNLVVPLIALNSITEWNQELTQIPGQPDWYMGILLHRDQRVIVVDTAQLIMPERLQRASEKRQRGSHILIVGDGRFGLACDSLQSPMLLQSDEVRWRRAEGYRPWMAGTVISRLSVLLNVDAILGMLGHK
ncbi:MAG: chemotaxis protein CheW [Sedimenticola sp.]|uniref:Chemotaxis protein CheW n=1 Tax=Sedimenticola thiotaurini TaxID=1543721 RepID=A0A558D3H6_9GAMM|nr:chemotaxis protein CheW [Sedimenticola sp.]TVT55570.1 MAG: chemotaxis protein CheW [Sedimenticola thiotaurini]